ncbi:MAG: peptidoglycan-binding protein [Defluviitaleaceae bacterium]|nr:peptidoglycan-binding protein [Defluviitaleaceae bacterium]
MPTCYAPIPAYPGFLIRMGARGDYVRQIQSCLNNVNNAGLATDGIFGPLTHAAVVNYQRANSLAPDGIVGPITWEHLMRRCFAATAARAGAMAATAEFADGIPGDLIAPDSASMGIEFAPNFAATDNTETEFVEESLGTVTRVGDEAATDNAVSGEVIPGGVIPGGAIPGGAIPEEPMPLSPPTVSMSNLLTYFLICKMNK